ncbi:hypothetical protein LOC68_27035 [Blastopirellula sp. JC732]|uniref:Neutral/alkaline non-lysosomal ceramidase n=1 Tax=Blastopirellula sediminis TaxID=2894196 RepID=A0A9X1SIA1_9BACT|nr:hypothetical protein [Blastopirellula sediminis]MCC9604636.1 hypothetical protein [Blastopirellula sediminis]MCC9632065.1 hypothetical protein [Blastopirellula sediminis]
MLSKILRCAFCLVFLSLAAASAAAAAEPGKLLAGTGKVDITDYSAGPANDPMFVKAIVIKDDSQTAVLISVDAVAIGELGRVKDDYLPTVRKRLEAELGIPPTGVLANASHCHGVILPDITDQTVQAVKQAVSQLTPVTIGAGRGSEDRIMENRRLKLKNGKEVDVRHAYSLPPDEEIAGVAPTDPEIGVVRLNRENGETLAVIYNFACHPIQGVPSGANTADIIGYSSKVIEENLSDGTLAMFLQGCAGDINPAYYKDVDHPRSAEPLGNLLGLSVLKAVRQIECQPDDRLMMFNQSLTLPRSDLADRIAELDAEEKLLLSKLRGTTLNFKTFLALTVKYKLSPDFPSHYSHRYFYDEAQEKADLKTLDAQNKRDMQAYLQNVFVMEQLTRLQTNRALLRKHQQKMIDSGKRTIDVELVGLRIGDFVMVTFPGELTSPIGMNIKRKSPHDLTFVAGYTNGYIYYCPTVEQMQNRGGAQEDSDCLLAPEWQEIFESTAAEMLKKL